MNTRQQLITRDYKSDEATLSRRLEAFRNRSQVIGPTPIDREHEQPDWPDESAVPEIDSDALNSDVLRSAMASSGCLVVRNFIDNDTAQSYTGIIDEVLAASYPTDPEYAKSKEKAAETGAVELPVAKAFHNPPSALSTLLTEQVLACSHEFHRQSGSAMCVYSASVCEQLLELYQDKHMKFLLEEYFNEEPCLSALKWVLRRSKLPVHPAGWHQDGAFMGAGINSINLWISLSRCGGDTGAPGIDLLPVRLKEIVGAGKDDAMFDWSLGPGVLSQRFGESSTVSPEFNPGDALFFDHFCLHRTQYKASFTSLRYAIETWFFGSGNFPKNQVPLAW